MPLLSIIVPIYNVEKYIKTCLSSLLISDNNIEYILVNDGSTDESDNIVRNIIKSYSNVKYIVKINGGISSARNVGLNIATGDYLMFVDSDDWLDNNYFEIVFDIIKKNPDVAIFGYSKYYSNKKIIDFKLDITEGFYNSDEILPRIDSNGIMLNLPWNKIYRRDIVGEIIFDENIVYTEDLIFNCLVFSRAKKIYISNYIFYHYRTTPNSLTNNRFYENYRHLANAGIIARENLYKNLNLFHENIDIINYKRVEYRLGEISNLYRKKSNFDRKKRKETIKFVKKEIKNFYKKTYNFGIQNIVIRIIKFFDASLSNFFLSILYKFYYKYKKRRTRI